MAKYSYNKEKTCKAEDEDMTRAAVRTRQTKRWVSEGEKERKKVVQWAMLSDIEW